MVNKRTREKMQNKILAISILEKTAEIADNKIVVREGESK